MKAQQQKQQHRDLLPPHQHTNKPWGAALATQNKSLSRSSEEYNFLYYFSVHLYPTHILPKSPALKSTFGMPQTVFPDVSKHKCVSTSLLFLLLIFQGMLVPFHTSLPSPYTPKANTQCMSVWETASTAPSEKKEAPVDFRMLSANEIFWSAARWWQMICINLALSVTLSKQRAASKAHWFEKWNDATWDFFVSYFLRCLLLSSLCLVVRGKLDDISRAESNLLQNNGETRSDKALVRMFALKLAYSGMEVVLALACAVACEPKELRLDPCVLNLAKC